MTDRRILVLAAYPLDRFDRGPQVRIYNIANALQTLSRMEMIEGGRSERRARTREFLRSGQLEGVYGLHVEANSAWANPSDIRLMAACKRRRIPSVTFIQDAHPLFPEIVSLPRWQRETVRLLWWASMQAYYRVSDAIAFQSGSFAALFRLPPNVRQLVLPPGGNEVTTYPLRSDANTLVYAGNGRPPRYGIDSLLDAADLARREFPDLKVKLICPPEDSPPDSLLRSRPWVTLKHLQTYEIADEMRDARAVMIPFRCVAYHHLLLPTKLMDYLAFRRPMLVTRCREISRFVEENELGLVVDDDPESMAEGIGRIFTSKLAELDAMGQRAVQLMRQKHSWRHRAQQILDTFDEIREARY